MWAGGGGGEVYPGVATSGTATQPLMLLPSAARCWCSVREPSVLASELNGKPVGGARLWFLCSYTQRQGYASGQGVYLL